MRGYFAWDDAHLDNGLAVEREYTRVYREYTGKGKALRELKCLEVALPAAAAPVQDGDLFVGRRMFRPLGVAPSYWDDDADGLDNVGWYADIARMQRVMDRPDQTEEDRKAIGEMIAFWKTENVNAKVRARFDGEMRREMPSDLWSVDSGVIFGLYRMVFSQLDYDKLVRLGLPGLREEVRLRLQDPSLREEQRDFLRGMIGVTDLLTQILGQYRARLGTMLEEGDEKRLRPMRECVSRLMDGAPACFRDALQLVWFYSAMTGGRDLGRMDV